MSFEVSRPSTCSQGQVVRLERGDYARQDRVRRRPARASRWSGRDRARRVCTSSISTAQPRASRPTDARSARSSSALRSRCRSPAGSGRSRPRRTLLAIGADRVVLGTKALTDESFLLRAVDVFGRNLVIAPDAHGREVRVSGWTRRHRRGRDRRRRAASRAPASQRLLVTDIGTDGMLTGPNVELLGEVARRVRRPGDRVRRRVDDRRPRGAREGAGHRGRDRRQGAVRRRVRPRGRDQGGGGVTLAKRVIPCLDLARGTRREERALRRHARRRRSGRARAALRRAGRGRDLLPRHHRDARGTRDDLQRAAQRRRAGLHPAHDRRRCSHGRRRATAACVPAPTRSR